VDIFGIVKAALKSLKHETVGGRSDALLLLGATAFNAPLCKRVLGASPILGFLAAGVALGPRGLNLVQDLHRTELLADLGVVLFLFEMGIHLSFKTLVAMRRDVFGLGGLQFGATAAVIYAVAHHAFKVSGAASVVLGGALALSSSAFVLQLLKDGDQMGTKFGKSSFGVLLLQDLMVVPLLVVTPILAGGGDGVSAAVISALVRLVMAVVSISLIGKFALGPVFGFVEGDKDHQDSMVGLILATVMGFSFLTEGLGLSNTLGAFLAGVLLSDTPYRHEIEREISPFRGILVGLFFFSVGFEIDFQLIVSKFGLVSSLVVGLMALKTAIAAGACRAFGLDMPTSQRIGLLLSQGGEFAFVAFRLALKLGVMDDGLTGLMLTVVALTMAATPFMDQIGGQIAEKAEKKIQ